MKTTKLQIKRVYDLHAADDGFRILVDRLWPRGLRRETAEIDLWLKGIAPSHDLRKWFGHQPARWGQFRERYFAELGEKKAEIEMIKDKLQVGPVTLLYSAKDCDHNQAVALQQYFKEQVKTN